MSLNTPAPASASRPPDILHAILQHKRNIEVPERKRLISLDEMRRKAQSAPPTRHFAHALNRADGNVALIAEIKRASPSKGIFIHGEFNPAEIARVYEHNGASAISVLTDEHYFHGHLRFLSEVKQAVGIPVLRKDFMVDEYQLHEARAAGADAILLIVAALDDVELRDFHQLAHALTLTALVEVHDEAETERAINIGAQVVGVNNRDLRTFTLDIETTARCAEKLHNEKPDAESVLVSESGIFTPSDVARVAGMGAHAILVGESIIVSQSMTEQVQALSSVKRAVINAP